ncbi:Protein IQ-DOMAIN like [Heracleum sosnowskyi]|uniref:Protein IQ-DOMAIN like n=1 Tax=Heracleum sosnowskyi TaxID=360622 RepID=A0AAD8HDK6_9APIA|nr:Protein IQ-DOMAIN like [Heracleum sosnowskyi]
MGKASKWLQKLLTRKREDKEENKDTSFSLEDSVLPAAIIPGTPNQKRRWSFGKSEASTDNNHNTSRSLDAIDSKRLVPLDLLEYRSEQNNGANHLVTFFVAAKYENEQEYTTTVPVPHNEATTYRVVSARFAAAKHFRAIADAAATKIQAFFRAHLARKALKALKGLVKIQALVRGHLVRKQTSEMLRCMNALMSIQVRARVQRIQMTEEPPIIVKRKLTHREPAHDQLRRGHSDNLNLTERRGSSRWNEDPISHRQIKTREHEFSTNYSERFSISKQELQSQVYTNPSPFTNTSSSQYEEYFYGTPNRISQQKYNVSNFGHIKAPDSPSVDYSGTTSHNSQFGHNYMANTHSSMANLRSSSEPKQRPLKQKTMRSPSFGGINTRPDTPDQIQSSNGQKKQPPWSIKRYRAAKSSKDIEYDSNRLGTSSSSSNRTLRHTR